MTTVGIDVKLLVRLRSWSLDYANSILEDKSCAHCLEIHSIALVGGGARCYFDCTDGVQKHKDLDIDIYYAPAENASVDGRSRMRINTQRRPAVGYFNNKRVDIARTVLLKPMSNSIVEDIRDYARDHKTNRWERRKGAPIVFIYPKIEPLKRL